MDTQSIESQSLEARKRRLPRLLTMAALACFALPFLTVTCYGDTTVSGVQSATEIDIYPNDEPGEKELLREEGPNAFAFVALAAAIAGVVLAFGSDRSREIAVWVAAVGAIALVGLFAYSFYRSWGGAWPRIGFIGSLMFLVGAAWAGVDRVPRWIVFAVGGLAAAMIPGASINLDDLPETAWIYTPVYAGVFIAVALAVGAITASVRSPEPRPSRSRPNTLRLVGAGIVGLVCVAAAAVGAPVLMGAMLSSPEYAPDGIGKSYVFATAVLTMTIAASLVAWIAGRAIVHGRRRRVPLAPMRAKVGVSQ